MVLLALALLFAAVFIAHMVTLGNVPILAALSSTDDYGISVIRQEGYFGLPLHHLPVPQAALLVRSAGGLAVFPGSVRAHPARHFPHPSAAVAAVPAPLAAPGADRSAAGFAHHANP
ncbi:hypothetical protein G6F65_021444 [Rhizopus arrhizus]|nr:hypothetical protein G6F65_021444 [Rhizopus arrhizus]